MFKFFSQIISNILRRAKVIDYTVVFVENNPRDENVPEKKILVVGEKGYSKWVYMKCPCGCGELVTLSLMKRHSPSWNLKMDRLKRITLSPSIWKKDGCKSHYWIKKGKLVWSNRY